MHMDYWESLNTLHIKGVPHTFRVNANAKSKMEDCLEFSTTLLLYVCPHY